jgi:uncharacterized protein
MENTKSSADKPGRAEGLNSLSLGIDKGGQGEPAEPDSPGLAVEFPALLFEDDPDATDSEEPPQPAIVEKQEAPKTPRLPESYGTGRLYLMARDPHWLYASWDLSQEQMRLFNSLSSDGHLMLRVHADNTEGPVATEVHVHPESRHWFVHVDRAGLLYVGALGYRDREKKWVAIAVSDPARTPPERGFETVPPQFATVPADYPLPELAQQIKRMGMENQPLHDAIHRLRAEGLLRVENETAITPGAGVATTDFVQKAFGAPEYQMPASMSSLETGSFPHQEMPNSPASLEAAGFEVQNGISSPTVAGASPPQRTFWFNVQAELVVYGGTEVDATVIIGGRQIQLRPDGTFSYRFALPEGGYFLPAVAISANAEDRRWVNLSFARHTEYGEDVGLHGQDPSLKAPLEENL